MLFVRMVARARSLLRAAKSKCGTLQVCAISLMLIGLRHKGCECPFGYKGDNCQYLTDGRLNRFVVTTAGLFALISIFALAAILLIKRRRKRQDYIISKHMGNPPTIDLIAQSLGTDLRMAEYQVAAVTPSGDRSSFIAGRHPLQRPLRKPAWAQRVAIRNAEDIVDLPRRAYYRESASSPESAVMLSDVELEDTSDHRRSHERKHYWPNDAHNDASNPIQIFDDISTSGDSDLVLGEGDQPRKFRGKRIV